MEPVRWGVLGTARIGRRKVLPGMMKSPLCKIVAVASRDEATAREMADELGIERAYGSYEEMLAAPDIEAVYNPLPNHLHVPMTIAAAKAGKHVLCEKPIALNAGEASTLKAAAQTVLIGEAFMIRHHPQWHKARDLIEEGAIGEVRAVNVLFGYFNVNADDIRNNDAIGGGALLDIGCYAVVSGRILFGSDPLGVVSLIDRDPTFKTDRVSSGLADFGSGRQLVFTVSTQIAPYQRIQVLGTRGRIEIRVPFNAPQGEPSWIFVDDGSAQGDRSAQAIELPACDQYELQGEAFSRAVRGETPLVGGVEDAIVNMRILDALTRSERSGRWEAP